MRRRSLLVGALAASLPGVACLVDPRLVWAADPEPAPRVVDVVARKFVFLPDEITLKRGEAVELALVAPEVVMGFFAPDLQLRAVIVPGRVTRVRFTPDRSGRFDFLCDVFCGDGHEGMNGRIVVID